MAVCFSIFLLWVVFNAFQECPALVCLTVNHSESRAQPSSGTPISIFHIPYPIFPTFNFRESLSTNFHIVCTRDTAHQSNFNPHKQFNLISFASPLFQSQPASQPFNPHMYFSHMCLCISRSEK